MARLKDKAVVWAILLVLMTISILPGFAQTSSLDITGNLVNNTQTATASSSTWQGGTFVPALTCWAPGDPGYCGPNPMIRPDGNINFSYGLGNLYQYANVAKSLPYSGTNLVTTGFLFSWSSKNGNGWDDGRLDQLSAYVNLYDKGGSTILESYNYNLNFIHNWTTYNWSQDWTKLRRPNEVSNVQFGFVGMDNNYWAGPYGPEITNVSFQLKYKPDPCVNNPLYSPDCPKFQEALQKNLTTTTNNDVVKTEDTTYTVAVTYQEQSKPKPLDKQDLFEKEPGIVELEFNEELRPIDVNIDRLITTLIKIDDNQQREQRISLDASTTAVQETEKLTQQVVKQAEQVASRFARLSTEAGISTQQQAVILTTSKDSKSQQSLSLFQAPTSNSSSTFQLQGSPQQFSVLQNPSQQTTSAVVTVSQDNKTKQQSIATSNITTQANIQEVVNTATVINNSSSLVQPLGSSATSSLQLTSLNPLLGQTQDIPTQQSNFLTNKADPLNSVLDSRPITEEAKQDNKVSTVRQNVQDSEIAGNLSISNIAQIPIGFNSYLITLADASFYQPKEIYRNQRTIDNRRALQNLRSDELHQQMINQQWR
jgi:hypothetical protein